MLDARAFHMNDMPKGDTSLLGGAKRKMQRLCGGCCRLTGAAVERWQLCV